MENKVNRMEYIAELSRGELVLLVNKFAEYFEQFGHDADIVFVDDYDDETISEHEKRIGFYWAATGEEISKAINGYPNF